ncbi:hypothetical protein [Actinomadura sp. 9N407]|uniref:hypothetical protein n=1 Tax=Actinomadura sp. 9N407 TaxID=3375154 RepID=UPI00379866D6
MENTSKKMAVSVPITLGIRDGKGKSLATKASAYAHHRTIGGLMPGARFGIGDNTYVRRAGAKKIDFKLGRTEWLPPTDQRVVQLTASDVKADLYPVDKEQLYLLGDPTRMEVHRDQRYDLDITFKVHSRHPLPLNDGKANAILRDKHGKIVGGTHPSDTDTWARFAPGWSVHRIETGGVPPTVDASRIEVYPQPSYY